MKNKKITSILILFTFLLAACSGTSVENLDGNQVSIIESSAEIADVSDETREENNTQITDLDILPEYEDEDLEESYDDLELTAIQLNGKTITFEGSGVIVEDSLMTITSGAHI